MKITVPTQSTPKEPKDAIAMVIDDRLWLWFSEAGLFLQLDRGLVPRAAQLEATADDREFVRAAASAVASPLPPLPVERGDTTSIGGVAVADAFLDLIEKAHGALAWRAWRGCFVGRDGQGVTVAIWRMPKGHGVQEVFLVDHDGSLWACNDGFAMKLRLSPEKRAQLLKQCSGPNLAEVLAKKLALAAAGTVVKASAYDGGMKIGDSHVPLDQVRAIEAACGEDLEWLWTGPRAALGARRNGQMVALVMPFKVSPRAAKSTGSTKQ